MKNKILWLLLLSFLVSCARVGSPNGGEKDTIPPKMIGSNIDSARVNVPTNLKELKLDFDEYIQLKDIQKNLIISPPIKYNKIIPSTNGNRYISIQWKDSLQANTTYSFNFGNAIVDLNEGNVLPYFNFAFSTGDKLDDLYISGTISDALGNEKSESGKDRNIVVGLYQVKDSIDYHQKPYYITKADLDGYFELNYLTPGKYKILGFDDENQNSIYESGKESVAFLKQDIDLTESISGLKLKLNPPKKTPKYKETIEAAGGLLMLFEGNPEKVDVKVTSDKPKDYRVTHRAKSDSVRIWFNPSIENFSFTTSESIKFSYNLGGKEETASTYYKKPKDTAMSLNNLNNKIVSQNGLRLSSNYIINKIQPENWILESDSISKSFTVRISESDSTQIIVNSDFVPGKKYQFTVPKNTVLSFYNRNDQSKRFDFEVAKPEDFGNFVLTIKNAPTQKFWVQLLNNQNKVVYQQYTNSDKIRFENLKPETYKLRILVDNNENSFWDTSDFNDLTLAEDVFLFKKSDDKSIMTKINIRPLWEINETWDLEKEEQPVN